MKLQPRIFATLCAVLISASAYAAQITLPSTLDQLMPDGDFAAVGDLTFDLFTYTGNGDMPIPEQIDVVATASNTGIGFRGPFLDAPAGIGNGASSAFLGYTVTSTVGITDVMLRGNPSLVGGSGIASVTETYEGFPTLKLDIFDDPSAPDPVMVEASASLGATANSLVVTQGITLQSMDAVISATLQFTRHEFIPVPEPTSLLLTLVGFVGIGALRRRRQP